jgi:hypothetical protein
MWVQHLALLLHFSASEVVMLLSARYPITSLYRVEVSGWDTTQSFFVEKSDLEWNEETGKSVILSHALTEDAMIFVRLLQHAAPDRSHAVAYEAEFVGRTLDGKNQFRLIQAQPRPDEQRMMIQ